MNDDFRARFNKAALACPETVTWRRPRSPGESLRRLSEACDELGLDQWDTYAERGPVGRLEEEVVTLLGKDAVAYFPSGIMAQQAALRVWCDRAGTRRIALPD